MFLKIIWRGRIDNNSPLRHMIARRHAIAQTNDGQVHWRIYASPGYDEFALKFILVRS